ncbi:diaminopimelate epimerase [Mariprofundus erugo]|uniref:diaminopimelate epimerase n=1 Tax=Mariprofundus erugo TaxID=2528639 RepID=UPI0010FE4833|nr:diaminopimelate epimerase [Mariprofundus erugo]TLS75232.1 diaminopimelate epimerase [Mariprofundus erugo]
MNQLPFTKMQAQGNDFVLLNGLTCELPELTEAFARQITERRYGIGCDQLLVLLPDDVADARMRIFNNDGSEAANCGNGLRCAGELLMQLGDQNTATIALADRIVKTSRSQLGVRVEMGAANITGTTDAHVDVNIGNEHRVFFEATESFPTDTNIEIITGQIADHIWIDIIERGAGHTPACGSGACATASAIWHMDQLVRPLIIEMPGGRVQVSGTPENLILEGSVSRIFDGNYHLPSDGRSQACSSA